MLVLLVLPLLERRGHLHLRLPIQKRGRRRQSFLFFLLGLARSVAFTCFKAEEPLLKSFLLISSPLKGLSFLRIPIDIDLRPQAIKSRLNPLTFWRVCANPGRMQKWAWSNLGGRSFYLGALKNFSRGVTSIKRWNLFPQKYVKSLFFFSPILQDAKLSFKEPFRTTRNFYPGAFQWKLPFFLALNCSSWKWIP